MAEGGRAQLALMRGAPPALGTRETTALIWSLGLGSFGLAWSKTTIGTYLPAVLEQYTGSAALIGFVLSAEGWFAIVLPLLVGPLSDATRTPFGRRRPYMAFALGPIALSLAMVAFMPNFVATAFVLFAFFFAYYIYEPPYRGLYPDLLPGSVFGRSQGAQHVMRGIAVGIALVSGGFLLHVWEPFPFVLAATVSLVALGAVVALVHERGGGSRHYERFRSHLAAPWRIVKSERDVRFWLLANIAWEGTFAGMYTFVVLYITKGLDQPLYISSTVLAVVAVGYVVAATLAGRLGDRFGIGRVQVIVSLVYGIGLTLCVFATEWHSWYYALIAPLAFCRWHGDDARVGAAVQSDAAGRSRCGLRPRDHDEGRGPARGPAGSRGPDRHLRAVLRLDRRLRGHVGGGRPPDPARGAVRRRPRPVRGSAG